MGYEGGGAEGSRINNSPLFLHQGLEACDQERMARQTLRPQPSTLIHIAQLDSGTLVHIPRQSPALNLAYQPPIALNVAQADFSIPNETSDRHHAPLSNGIDAMSVALPPSPPAPFTLDLLKTTVKDTPRRPPVSCHSCRSAKIRCDRVHPACRSCRERSVICTYDESVKRRGQDKNPRTRSRRLAPSGSENQARARPYQAARPKKDLAKPVIRIDATSSTPTTSNAGSSSRGKRSTLRGGIHPPSFPVPATAVFEPARDPYNDNFSLTRIPAGDLASHPQPYDSHLHESLLNIPHQDWPPDVTPSPAHLPLLSPARGMAIGGLYNHRSHGSSESTQCEAKAQPPRYGPPIGRQPSLRFSQDTWWDTVLSMYDPTSKVQAAYTVTADLHAFFKSCSGWLYFVNVPLFFDMFYHPEQRSMMQPALVLGCLAYSAFIKGSEMEGGEEQRQKALRLRDFGQAAFDASYNAGCIDIPLAQASWIFALFESCVHPEASIARMGSSLRVMDNVISILGLTSIDAEHPRTPIVFVDAVPAIGRRGPEGSNTDTLLSINPLSFKSGHPKYQPARFVPDSKASQHTLPSPISLHCPCEALAMEGEPDQMRSNPLWLMTPKWDRDAPHGVVRREEGRRLVWCAIRLVGGDINRRLPTGTPLLDLELAKPNNFALLYPGEHLYHQDKVIDTAYSSKESTWALYARAVHLWVACTTHRDTAASPHDKTDFGMKTWMETIAIEDALNEHDCDGERSTMFQARECLFNIRMFISDQYRRFIPIPQSEVNFSHFDCKRAMDWLIHQNDGALQLRAASTKDPDSDSAKVLLRHPFFIWWQRTQIWRALTLFDMDSSLTLAVDVALNMLPVFLSLQEMWPCAEQRRLSQPILERLLAACQKTGRTLLPLHSPS